MMRHVWRNYEKRAFAKDELRREIFGKRLRERERILFRIRETLRGRCLALAKTAGGALARRWLMPWTRCG